MSRDEKLRRWLCENGFSVSGEKAATQSGKVYTVLTARYTGDRTKKDDTYYYIGDFTGKTPEEKEYIKKTVKRLYKQARADKSVLPVIEKAEVFLK